MYPSPTYPCIQRPVIDLRTSKPHSLGEMPALVHSLVTLGHPCGLQLDRCNPGDEPHSCGLVNKGSANGVASVVGGALECFILFVMMTSSLSTLDSTFTSVAKLVPLELCGWLKIPGMATPTLTSVHPERAYSFTPPLLHYSTIPLLYTFTPSLLHSFTPQLLTSSTPPRLHPSTPPLFHSSTPLLRHSSTPPLLHCSTASLLSVSGIMCFLSLTRFQHSTLKHTSPLTSPTP